MNYFDILDFILKDGTPLQWVLFLLLHFFVLGFIYAFSSWKPIDIYVDESTNEARGGGAHVGNITRTHFGDID